MSITTEGQPPATTGRTEPLSSDLPPPATTGRPQPLSDDLLFGAEQIGAEIGKRPSQIYHIAKTKILPIGKVGKQLVASRRALRRAIDKLTAA